MATVKEYAYYIKGTKLALIEKDTAFDNDPNSRDYGPGAEHANWKSPITAVTDGIELEYVYSPLYRTNIVHRLQSLTGYFRSSGNEGGNSESGMVKFVDAESTYTNFDSYMDVGDKFVLKKAGRYNGIHEVVHFESATGTNNIIVTNTPCNDTSIGVTVVVNFENTPDLYYNIEYLEDESDDIDLPSYLSKALVYYVKAKLAEDKMNMEAKEYFMKEFRKMVEKYDSTRYPGVRRIVSGFHAIR